MKTLPLMALGLALALPTFGQTENVAFTVLAQTQSGSGPANAQQTVIRTPQGMSAVDPWLSTPAPFVEWGKEVVVLVALGTQPSGGYAVEVTGVTRSPLSGGPGYRYEVNVREQSPSGPAISILTQPFQIVKFRAGPNDPIAFLAPPTLPPPPPMADFDSVRFTQATPGTFGPPSQRSVTVKRSGEVELTVSMGVPVTIPGRATPQELQTVRQLARRARLRSVPDPLQVTVLLPAAVQSWSLRVDSVDAAANGQTSGAQLGSYGAYDARLRPLIDALSAIADRLGTQPPQTHSGELRVRGSWVLLRLPSGEELRLQPQSVARSLRGIGRELAEVEGTISASPSGPRVLTVDRVISPRRERSLRGVVRLDADGDPTLTVGGGPELQVVGPVASLVQRAVGKTITVDTWVLGQAGNPTGLRVEAVQARARITTSVYERYRWVGRLFPGFTVWVEGTSSSMNYARIRRGQTRAGWVRTRTLELGDSVPTPTASAPSTGITGSMGQ